MGSINLMEVKRIDRETDIEKCNICRTFGHFSLEVNRHELRFLAKAASYWAASTQNFRARAKRYATHVWICDSVQTNFYFYLLE